MSRLSNRIATLALLCATLPLAYAQNATDKAAAPPAAPPRTSQVVHADRSVTFRFVDAAASTVELSLENAGKPLPMVKDATGLWSVTTAPLPPAIYGYSFIADGQPRVDPYNPVVIGNLYYPPSNGIEVPGDGPEPWDDIAVPHGQLHHHQYTTHVAEGMPENQSEYIVYTPPGYEAGTKKDYPVLYLLHGWSDKVDGWTAEGRANLILDNLIAQGKAKPMIVVMPLGYGDMSFVHDAANWTKDEPIEHNLSLYTQVLLTEVLPRVEQEYRVSRRREDRAIAGLSMGGLEALSIGLNHTSQFAYVAGFSAAVHRDRFIQSLQPLTAKDANLKLLWVACGASDGLLEPNRKLAAYLKTEGLPVTAIETPGFHTWPVWRDNLVHLAPLLFQTK